MLAATLGGTACFGLAANAEIVRVGYEDSELPQLSTAEQERLDLLSSIQMPLILSSVSPDGRTVVVATVGRLDPSQLQLSFLDLVTGELEASTALDAEVISPETPMRWINNHVIQFVQSGMFSPWEIVTINRQTDIVSRTMVAPTREEEGEILGIAPDFSKFVVRVFEADEDVVYMVSIPSLERLEVARLPDGLEIRPPAWSENGDQMVLVTSAVEERGLYDRTPFSPNFADPVIQDALGRLEPEENIFRQHNQVRVFDFRQPEPLQFELNAAETDAAFFANADISPNGQTILLKMFEPGQVEGRDYPSYLFPKAAHYRFYDLQGNQLDTVQDMNLAGPLENMGRFMNNQQVLFVSSVGIDRHFFRYDLGREQLEPLPLPSGVVEPEGWDVTPDGKTLVYSFSAVTQPPEVFSLPLEPLGKPQQLTTINQEIAAVNQVRADRVQFTTRNGKRQGLLVQPASGSFPPQEIPVVFWQQGGPGFAMLNEFAIEVEMPLNLLPNFGVSVLLVPLAGREGLGPETYQLLARGDNFGQVDILEGVDVISQLVSRGWSRPDQVGVSGCSYGGYYAAQAVARFPQVFAAANPQCSLLDTFTEWQLGYSSLLSYLTGSTPMENPEHYRYMSPLYNAQQVRTPTMMFHGSEDFLHVDVARNFHDIIELQGGAVTLYEFEGTGHAIYDPGLQRTAAQLQIDFFRRHLQGSE